MADEHTRYVTPEPGETLLIGIKPVDNDQVAITLPGQVTDVYPLAIGEAVVVAVGPLTSPYDQPLPKVRFRRISNTLFEATILD